MKRNNRNTRITAIFFLVTLLFSSCVSYRYIHNEESLQLQKKIQGRRTANIAGDSFLTLGSAVLAFFTGVYVGYTPGGQSLKSIKLLNAGIDTLQVNLLSDFFWKDSVYCDFRDIRIPPGEKCRLLVPAAALYNLYFSNTINSEEDDEMIRVDPLDQPRIILNPGMTLQKNDTSNFITR